MFAHKIRRIGYPLFFIKMQVVLVTGYVSTLAGSGTSGSSDGTGLEASFSLPW